MGKIISVGNPEGKRLIITSVGGRIILTWILKK
jgi:hypothetical protein